MIIFIIAFEKNDQEGFYVNIYMYMYKRNYYYKLLSVMSSEFFVSLIRLSLVLILGDANLFLIFKTPFLMLSAFNHCNRNYNNS